MTWWNSFVGVPFADCGRDRSGVDCYGLVRLVYQEVANKTLPMHLGYTHSQDDSVPTLIEQAKYGAQFIEVPPDQVQDLDIVVLKVGGVTAHLGIICDNKKSILHVVRGANSVIERRTSLRWGGRIESYWRVL